MVNIFGHMQCVPTKTFGFAMGKTPTTTINYSLLHIRFSTKDSLCTLLYPPPRVALVCITCQFNGYPFPSLCEASYRSTHRRMSIACTLFDFLFKIFCIGFSMFYLYDYTIFSSILQCNVYFVSL